MKRHCKDCGGKMKFHGVSGFPGIYKVIWYKCTQCDYKEWRFPRKWRAGV